MDPNSGIPGLKRIGALQLSDIHLLYLVSEKNGPVYLRGGWMLETPSLC
jgi:hypothetical protein